MWTARHSRLGVQKYYFLPKKKVIVYLVSDKNNAALQYISIAMLLNCASKTDFIFLHFRAYPSFGKKSFFSLICPNPLIVNSMPFHESSIPL